MTFTATVTVVDPGSTAVASPTGTVTFYDSGTSIGTGTLAVVNGLDQASYTTSTLSTAIHTITAAYTSGDGNFNASPASSPTFQYVFRASTATSVTGPGASAVSGQPVTFTATVTVLYGSTAVASPSGTVTFYDAGTSIGTGTLAVVNGLDQATYTTSALAIGSHTITAAYTSGDGNFNASPASSPITQVVGMANTATSVATSGTPSVSGQSVTFTATVTVAGLGSTAVASPTGTVTFYDAGTAIGTGTLAVVNGLDQATYTTSALATGSNTITAAYTSGDGNFNASPTSSPITQVVAKANTTTSVITSGTPTVSGQSVTFTATVTVAGLGSTTVASPTGTVTFYDAGTAIGMGTLAVVNGLDQATYTTSAWRASHTITSSYTSGDGNFNASPASSPITQVVGMANTATSVATSGTPSVSGQSVTFTATVTVASPGSTTVASPTGTVTFYDAGTSVGTGTLAVVNGLDQATYTTSVLGTASHAITAAYISGDGNFNPSSASSPITQVAAKANTTTSVITSNNSIMSGQPVTFTATVTVASPGSMAAASPTGTVTFYDAGTAIGTGTLAVSAGSDQATYTTSAPRYDQPHDHRRLHQRRRQFQRQSGLLVHYPGNYAVIYSQVPVRHGNLASCDGLHPGDEHDHIQQCAGLRLAKRDDQ